MTESIEFDLKVPAWIAKEARNRIDTGESREQVMEWVKNELMKSYAKEQNENNA